MPFKRKSYNGVYPHPSLFPGTAQLYAVFGKYFCVGSERTPYASLTILHLLAVLPEYFYLPVKRRAAQFCVVGDGYGF
jgi:hypothetical protein